jgi:hypothetical protein
VSGIQAFTKLTYGKEATPNTAVAPTRYFYAEGTAVLLEDRGFELHADEHRARRSEIGRAPTQVTEDVELAIRSVAGVSWSDLVWPLSALNGTATGVGGAADKTWTQTPSMTASNSPKTYSIDYGDDTQGWRVQGAAWTEFTIESGIGQLTQLSGKLVGQRSIKNAMASPAGNATPKIPGGLWTLKQASTFAGLPGASVLGGLMVRHRLTVRTGLLWEHFQDGNLYGSGFQETVIGGDLELTIQSTATAVSAFYDQYTAGTLIYVRLKATGGALGGSNYSAQWDLPIVLPEARMIDSHDKGVNIYKISAQLADDGTNPPISPVVVNDIAALP